MERDRYSSEPISGSEERQIPFHPAWVRIFGKDQTPARLGFSQKNQPKKI
jgi:hypothetical protein